jgi:hypothetical protein
MTDPQASSGQPPRADDQMPTDQLLEAYGEYRVRDQIGYYERRAATFERALRRTTNISAALLVFAALWGALGAVDEKHRGMWAFLAAGFAALATAVATYEATFGFERLARQYRDTATALRVALATGPDSPDGQGFVDYVERVERLLRDEVDRWSRSAFDAGNADQPEAGKKAPTQSAELPPPENAPKQGA